MNVRISPAMGMITDSDTFRIMANTPGENPAGDVPTWVATSDMQMTPPLWQKAKRN